MTAPAAIARVMVDSPLPQLDRLFDYAVPVLLDGQVVAGIRVRVPLRSAGRIAEGYVVEVVSHVDYPGVLSEIESVISPVVVLAPEVWAVARAVADRAAGSASDVIRLAVPRRQVRVEKLWMAESAVSTGFAEPAAVEPAAAEPAAAEPAAVEPAEEAAVSPSDLGTIALSPVPPLGFDAETLSIAIRAGSRLAVTAVPRVVSLQANSAAVTPAWVGQWATLMAAAAAEAIKTGGSAILCVPDYRDQEQLLTALAVIVPADRVVRLDARQTNPERYRAFLACLGEHPLVIVGNRSVVYAPATRLALIAIWDDGDPLLAEPLSPYVHARDAALVRQKQQGCALWLVGHARSTEVQRLVALGYLGELAATRSYTPKVIPTAAQAPQDRFAAIARIPSSAWKHAREALNHGPVLVQVARPGFAPRLACESCHQSARCPRCEGPLGTKTARAAPGCLWCGALAADWHCATCEGTRLRQVGQGSVRTAEELGRGFPGIRIIVADGDHQILRVDNSPALVVATRGAEPVAAGGYRAVLLLDGERMLARESLRVGEDCLRWWSNAAALAAPGAPVVLVGVGGALASAMSTWRLADYAAAELSDRRTLRFPPAVRVATVTGTVASVEAAVNALADIENTDVLGPTEITPGSVRAIVRFDYAQGEAVTGALRAEVIRAATSRRKRVAPAPGRAQLNTLKVRCDDTEPFTE